MKKIDIAAICLFVFFAGLAAGYMWRFKQVEEGQKENRVRIEALEKELKEIQDLRFNIQKNRKIEITATGYCNHEVCINVKAWRDGMTASNTLARRGVCAADWSVFPQGTRLYVKGYGLCVVEDKGGKVRGKQIDLFFETLQEAKEWGRKKTMAVVIG